MKGIHAKIKAVTGEEPTSASGVPRPSLTAVAPSLAKNPLGIVALAFVLVYALAVVVMWGPALDRSLAAPLVWFLVVYPVLVLGVFAWLIAKHPTRLYAPSDFRDDDAFLAATEGRVRSAAFLSAAQVRRDTGNPVDPSEDSRLSGVVNAVAKTIPVSSRAKVLWVDDHPENNVWEREALMAAGLGIQLALTTTQALELLTADSFQLVISDMNRAEGSREGYVLLEEMRHRGEKTPLIFYTGSNSAVDKQEAREHAGQGLTNDPTELYELAMALVTRP